MILLDTNVLSELRRIEVGRTDPAVAAWTSDQILTGFYISALTVLEIELGILRVTPRDAVQAAHLRRWLDGSVLPSFASRILPVNAKVALACAPLHLARTRPYVDSLIAATALVHNLTLATRNVRDFADTGVRLIDPWAYRVGTGSSPE